MLMDAMGKDTDRLSLVVALMTGVVLAFIMDAGAPIRFVDFLAGHGVLNGDPLKVSDTVR
jgi:hypothetical protein